MNREADEAAMQQAWEEHDSQVISALTPGGSAKNTVSASLNVVKKEVVKEVKEQVKEKAKETSRSARRESMRVKVFPPANSRNPNLKMNQGANIHTKYPKKEGEKKQNLSSNKQKTAVIKRNHIGRQEVYGQPKMEM